MTYNPETKVEDLQKCSLFIATPMFGGMCHSGYTKSLYLLTQLCNHLGIPYKTYFLTNESLIQRARNYCAEMFLQSNMTHMIFIDADIEFNPDDVIKMLGIQITNKGMYDVLGGAYSKKGINWNKVAYFADKVDNLRSLEKVTGDFVFNSVQKGNTDVDMAVPNEVLEIGTGFMLIPRYVFERFARRFPKYRYRPDHANTEHFDGSNEITAFFHCEIDPKSKRYLSEDYFFCQKIRQIGMKVHMIPWVKLIHYGTYAFRGSIADEFELVTANKETVK